MQGNTCKYKYFVATCTGSLIHQVYREVSHDVYNVMKWTRHTCHIHFHSIREIIQYLKTFAPNNCITCPVEFLPVQIGIYLSKRWVNRSVDKAMFTRNSSNNKLNSAPTRCSLVSMN